MSNFLSQQQQDILDMFNRVKNNGALTSNLYFIDDNSKSLKRKIPKKKGKSKHTFSERIVVPKSLVNELISSAHARHFGITKNEEIFKR